jgi:hypothetical protein
MYLILRYANGRRAEALLLTFAADSMRVILRQGDETIGFRLASGRWVGDDGSRVTIEAMVPIRGMTASVTRERALSAGGAAPC